MLVAAGPAAAIHHLLLGVLSPSPAAYNVVAGNQAALDREKSSPHRRPHPTRAPATDYISLFTGWPDQSPARRHQHEERRGDGLRVTIYDIAWTLPAEEHHDWRPEPHSRRRTRLDELFTGVAPPLQLSPSTTGQDKALQWLDPSSARVGIEGVWEPGMPSTLTTTSISV